MFKSKKYHVIGILVLFATSILFFTQSSHAFVKTIHQETFETDGQGTRYNSSILECSDGSTDYFLRTNGSDINATYLQPEGQYFWAVMDIDDCPGSSGGVQTLSISPINVSEYTDLQFKILLAEDDDGTSQDWDNPDYVHITYQVDGGGYTNLLWIENNGNTYNSAPFIDSDFDGVGDSTEITNTFSEFVVSIPETGSLLDIQIEFSLDSGDEDIAIDNIRIEGDKTGTYHTISVDGDLSDWDSGSEKLGSNNPDGLGLEYFTTWDETYLYVAYPGGGANDQYNVAIDIDPDDVGANNSGTTDEYCGATFGADGKPDYLVQMAADNNTYFSQGSSGWQSWSPADTASAKNGTPNNVEFRISWADLGLLDRSDPIGIYLWACNNSVPQRLWASYPPTNPNGYSGNLEFLSTRIYFPTTDSARLPRFYAQHKGDQTEFAATGSFSLLNGFADFVITNGGGPGCNMRVGVKGNAAADTDNSALRRQYVIEPDSCPGLEANMTLRYMDGDFAAPSELNGLTEADLQLFRWDGSQWVDMGGTVDDVTNTVTVNGITNFSPWTFSTGSGPTAVSLQSFTGETSTALPALFAISMLLLLGSTLFIWQRKRQ